MISAGAGKVYAAARDPQTITQPGVIPVRLDVTCPDDIETLARELGDVNLVVNNAGIGGSGPVLAPSSIAMLREQFETNAVGPLRITQAFSPILATRDSSAVINSLQART
ncbi:SDR family NAD(P)-dependent oxidoreductase [Pantoea agglomerans]|uniref:SDR family NAD(P)-dependent oxidoreductase n=1 Tax=Enterobacter agglomerans TaxID=549 RepID=UPI003BFA7A24